MDQLFKLCSACYVVFSYIQQLFLFNFFLAERAKSSFENLKKRYFKKRCASKKSQKSGTSRSEVEKAEAELRQFSFLTWLDPFIRLRETRSNIDTTNQVGDNCFEQENDNGNDNSDDEVCFRERNECNQQL